MLSRRSLCLSAVALASILAGSTMAQELKIATVNPAKVFNEMQETKDLKQTMQATQRAVQDDEQRRVNDVEEAKKKVRIYQPGTDEYNKANKELLEKAIALQTWRQLMQQELQRQQKDQMKQLFKKIESAAQELAKAKNLDIVLVDQRPEIPDDLEQINVEQLRMLINQRTTLFNSDKFDMSADIVKKLDADYKKK